MHDINNEDCAWNYPVPHVKGAKCGCGRHKKKDPQKRFNFLPAIPEKYALPTLEELERLEANDHRGDSPSL